MVNPPWKYVDAMTSREGTSGEDKGASKGNFQYIVAIIGGELWANIMSKGTMTRKIVEMMVLH